MLVILGVSARSGAIDCRIQEDPEVVHLGTTRRIPSIYSSHIRFPFRPSLHKILYYLNSSKHA